jgi:hypothetical protein
MEMCTFPEAVQKIVQLADLDVSIANMNDYGRSSGLYDQQKRIEQILKVATLYYSVKMVTDPAASIARKHLMSRRIRPDTAFKFQIGYAPHPGFSSPSNSIYRASEETDQSTAKSITANITGTALYCTALYCTVLHCTVLHCTLYCTALYCTVLHFTVLYRTVLYCHE